MNWIVPVTFVGFTALVAIISWWKTRNDKLDTEEGYFLAGRGLMGPVIAGSLLMTNLSAEQLVGMNGQSVRIGMSPMGWEVTSAIALVILAFVLMPKYLKVGLTTVPQFLRRDMMLQQEDWYLLSSSFLMSSSCFPTSCMRERWYSKIFSMSQTFWAAISLPPSRCCVC